MRLRVQKYLSKCIEKWQHGIIFIVKMNFIFTLLHQFNTHLEIGKKKIFRTHWLQRSKSKINKKYDNAPNH